MKYYIIYLLNGLVVDISSWDEEDARNQQYEKDAIQVAEKGIVSIYGFAFDEVQFLNQVR